MYRLTSDELERVDALHIEYLNHIQPSLVVLGRHSTLKVSNFLCDHIHANVNFDETAALIIAKCTNSESVALRVWIHDFKKINGEQVHDKLHQLIRHYSQRAAFNDREAAYYQRLRQQVLNNKLKKKEGNLL